MNDLQLKHYKEQYPKLSEQEIKSIVSEARMHAGMATDGGSPDYEGYENAFLKRENDAK